MEEEIRMAETEQGDAESSEAESTVNISSSSPTKRGRGRPQGLKKLRVWVTDVNLMEMVSGISNGGTTQPQRGRGRPKLSGTKHVAEEGSIDADNSVKSQRGKGRPKGSKTQASNGDSLVMDHAPKKRGRPKKFQTPEKTADKDLANGGSNTPKMGRGRPKGTVKRKSESLTSGEEDEGSPVPPRKRGRPKGSPNKKPRLEKEMSSEGETDESPNSTKRGRGRLRKVKENKTGGSTEDTSNGVADMPRRGRGRPRKTIEQKSGGLQEPVTDGSQPAKRGRGRPKGSLNKKPPYKMQGNVGRPRRAHVPFAIGKCGRSRKQPAKRGRPRKYPLPSPEELKKPKVWKPLGRPRKYPRIDPPEGAPSAPRRSRGRPRKSESKKGAHLRKSWPSAPSNPHRPSDGTPRKRGRPPSTAKSEDVTPRKRGRPKGSLNKNKVRGETHLNSVHRSLSEKSDSAAAGVQNDGEPAEQQPEHHTQAPDKTDERLIERGAGFEVSNQA